MPKRSAKSLLMFLGLFTLMLPVGAESKLERFEKDATQARGDSLTTPLPLPPESTSAMSEDVRQLQGYTLVWVPLLMLAGGMHSWKRVQPVAYAGGTRIPPRQPGDALIPYVRVDTSEHRISSNLHAVDARTEVGYGPIGFSTRKLRYSEASSGANLELWQNHVLYRMSAAEVFEIDLGYGHVHVRGLADSSGTSWTLPVFFHPRPQWGVEYRPVWMSIRGTQTIDDELAVSIGDHFWAVRAGYHRLRSPAERLQGAFIGFSLRL